ncbi:XdhC family protein (plasmid) [Natrialbaceae archaeon A-arb3/5]
MTDTRTESTDREDPWSITKQDLFDAMREYRTDGAGAVVATVVDVEGSAYRRPGAKMLIDPDRESLGAITAGCLEGPVTDLAADVLESGEPSVHTFDLMDDEGWGLGLGCNGIIDILMEPLDASWDAPLSELADHRPVGTVTVVDADDERVAVGDRISLDQHGDSLSSGRRNGLPDDVLAAVERTCDELRQKKGAATVGVDTEYGSVDVFVDWLTPAPDLLLFGTQNDVHPVARIGREAGFRVVIASTKGARSDLEQFPNAHAVKRTRAMDVGDVVEDPSRTYAVIMSHNAIDDRLALASLADTDVPYIGLMGPRERFEEIREDLETEEDRTLTDEELARIATPVGLDLGGGEPTQIALSIVSEALAVHNGRDGDRLKSREGPIHARLSSIE